jgi:AcrR family transcriptional regulator
MRDTSSRSYHSPRREAAALATRRAVLDAAASLFSERGYAATTLPGVAGAAGVSLATVKLIAPTKARLLLEAFRSRVRGDGDEAALEQREAWRSMLREPEPAELVRHWVELTAAAHERSAPLLEAVVEASGIDPEVAEVERSGAAGRRASYLTVVEELAQRGALRPDLALSAAIDVAWVINSPRTFRLFAELGWSTAEWTAWLTGAMRRELLGG